LREILFEGFFIINTGLIGRAYPFKPLQDGKNIASTEGKFIKCGNRAYEYVKQYN